MKFLRDGKLIYTTKHWGWDKGKELFENDITIKVEAKNKDEQEVLIIKIMEFLNGAE